MNEIKYMDIKEFREKGFLQEANRQFFHPLGLALEISIDDDTGEERLSGVWDYRDDPEGMMFANGYGADLEKAKNIQDLRRRHYRTRVELFHPGIDTCGMTHQHLFAHELDVQPIENK